jgi:hypothetical protein
VSKFNEQRLAEELGKIVGDGPNRRRNDLAVFVVSLGIGVFGNFYFGKVEVGAVFLAVALFALGDLICSSWRWKGFKRVTFDVVFLVVFMWSCSSWLWEQYGSQHAALLQGDLIAPSNSSDNSDDLPHIRWGMNGGTVFRWGGGPNKSMMGIASDKIFIKKVNGAVMLTTTVKDHNGNLIVDIKDNHWEVSSNKADCWDKNYTSNILEVKNGRGRVVLQVKVLTDEIQIQGEWDDRGYSAPEVLFANGQYNDEDGISPLFKYPSSQHWGAFVEEHDFRLRSIK